MRIVLTKEAYESFQEDAKARNITTRELGVQVINAYIVTNPKK